MKNDSEKCDIITASAVQSMLRNMTDMVFVKDTELVYLSASQSFATLVGAKDPTNLIGKTDAQLFDDEELVRRYTDDDRSILASGRPRRDYIEPFWMDDRSRGYCQTSKFPIFDERGNIIGLYGVSRDVTWEYKAKLNYEQELHSLFELPPDALGAALFDVTNWRVVDTCIGEDTVHKMMNFNSVEDFIKDSADAIVDDEDARTFYASISQESLQSMYDNGKRRLNLEYQRKFTNKSLRWVNNELYFISDPVNGNLCVMSILLDIDKEKQEAHALVKAAEQDALTGVYNRKTTMAQIHSFLSEEGAANTHLLFMIDIDNFKRVNDTFGHQMGDKTLIRIASAIRKVFRTPDIVGRIGGDEFFALMKNVEDSHTARIRAMELVEALQYEYSEGDANIEVSGSVGISRYAGDGKTLERLYTEADSALYKAKQMGKNRFVFASEADGTWRERETLNTVNLRTLLENMDAAMFQTELDDKGEVCVTYSSHRLFSDLKQHTNPSTAHHDTMCSAILPEDLEQLKKAVQEATVNGAFLDCSCRIVNSMGQIEWRYVRGTQLPEQGDGVRRMIHVATDITKQKKTEAELREKSGIIDFAMRNTDVNMWYFDYENAECQLTKSCQKAHEMLGVERLKNFPSCLFEIGYVREDCIELLRSKYEQVRLTGKSTEFDVWFRRADGTGWWCERDMLSPLVDADGRVIRGIGIGKNVTAEKVLEERYQAFGAYRRLAENNTRVSFRMNLTTGWIGDCISSNEVVRKLYPVDSVDTFLHSLRERIVTVEDAVHFDTMFSRHQLLEAFSQGESLRSMECHYRIEDDHVIWLRITVEMVQSPITNDVEAFLYSFDIDHEKNMHFLVEKLLDVDYEFLGIINVLTGRLMVFGENVDVSSGMARDGFLYDEEVKRVFQGLILEEYYDEGVRNMSCANIMKELETKNYYACSFPAKDFAHMRAGRKQWKFTYLDNSKSKILMARSDITNIYTAEYDSLTGLYNRETFYRHVRKLLDENTSEDFLLLRFDIDRFKAYNDVYGTQGGDHLLAAVGRAAREMVWADTYIFGRLEADHFVFIMPAKKFNAEAFSIEHMAWFYTVTEGYRLTSSVGVYEITDPSVEVSLMCDRALLALRTVKDSYTRKVDWYNESLREKLMSEQALADDMEQALLDEQFVLFFQPLINYDTGLVIGAEALVRWQHPKRGLIPPGEFIPLFEKNGFIIKLDLFVWEKSCAYLRRWLDMKKTLVPISVNVSRCDLYDPELCERFQTLLNKYDLPFSLLKLEITESAYMDNPDQLVGIVNQLRSLGFTVEMDDFGTGYSSLNMLKDIPVDILKLDTRFISESESDTRAVTILSSIICMARQLGLSVIAEGVETKAQADTLKNLNCSNMQGFYFGRPMPVKDFECMIHANGNMSDS